MLNPSRQVGAQSHIFHIRSAASFTLTGALYNTAHSQLNQRFLCLSSSWVEDIECDAQHRTRFHATSVGMDAIHASEEYGGHSTSEATPSHCALVEASQWQCSQSSMPHAPFPRPRCNDCYTCDLAMRQQ